MTHNIINSSSDRLLVSCCAASVVTMTATRLQEKLIASRRAAAFTDHRKQPKLARQTPHATVHTHISIDTKIASAMRTSHIKSTNSHIDNQHTQHTDGRGVTRGLAGRQRRRPQS
mmetsp:Transcript_23451/g.57918  ORF Transcript_23451/g.57918 Transcript_23451/m.57918 type:complete len:115 (+) Transcript_23451:44-388(+)